MLLTGTYSIGIFTLVFTNTINKTGAPISQNKVLLEHRLYSLHILYGCFHYNDRVE